MEKLLSEETILDDSYPVYIGFVYIADMKFVRSPLTGSILSLKKELGAKEIRRCELFRHGNAKLGDELEV